MTTSRLRSFVVLLFLEKQPVQGFQVVQDSATIGHVLTQFRQVGGDKLEGLLAASRLIASRLCDVRIHVTLGFLDRFDEQFHKLLRTLDVVKWSLCPVAHSMSIPIK
jgi:hypothetical protein